MPSLLPTALPGPGFQPQLSSCSPLMTGLHHSQLDRNYGKSCFIGSTVWAQAHNASGRTEGELPECIPSGTNTCLGMNPPHPAAPNSKPACPETHTTSSHGESTQNCCKYPRTSCLHKGRAASPVNLKILRCTHIAATSERSCDISGKSSGWEHLLPGRQFLWSMLPVPAAQGPLQQNPHLVPSFLH